MNSEEITIVLTERFGDAVQVSQPDAWQVEINGLRLLVLLSEDLSWLRSLVTIAPIHEARIFMPQLLEANFDETQETRYAFFQEVLWGVYQHRRESLTVEDFHRAIDRLLALQQQGLTYRFNQLAEQQIRQIIQASKQQGQSLEASLQTLERLYEEGVMGDIDANAEQRQQVLGAWRYQLERLWDDVE